MQVPKGAAIAARFVTCNKGQHMRAVPAGHRQAGSTHARMHTHTNTQYTCIHTNAVATIIMYTCAYLQLTNAHQLPLPIPGQLKILVQAASVNFAGGSCST